MLSLHQIITTQNSSSPAMETKKNICNLFQVLQPVTEKNLNLGLSKTIQWTRFLHLLSLKEHGSCLYSTYYHVSSWKELFITNDRIPHLKLHGWLVPYTLVSLSRFENAKCHNSILNFGSIRWNDTIRIRISKFLPALKSFNLTTLPIFNRFKGYIVQYKSHQLQLAL